MKKSKAVMTIVAVTFFIMLAAPSAMWGQTFNWKLSVFGTPSDWEYQGIKYFVDNVSAMTNGRLAIKMFQVGVLYPPTESVSGVSRGLSEMAVTGGYYLSGVHKAFGVYALLPGGPIMNFWEHQMMVRTPEYQALTKKLYGPKIQHVGHAVNPPTAFLSRKPITKAADYKGLLVRTASPRDRLFIKLGAKPSYIATPEIYTGLQLGTIDAVDKGGYVNVYALKLHEVTKYIIEPAFVCPTATMDFFANQAAWDTLPKDIQACVKEAAISTAVHFWVEAQRQGFEARQKMIDFGLKVNTIPPEEMLKIYKDARDVWKQLASESPEASEAVKLYLNTAKTCGYPVD
jgi:TRAP-type C4-dicarboxylate transport system substrate-binding protein